MKAVISVTRGQYSKLFGRSFQIKDLLNGTVGLLGVNRQFPDNQTDFSFDEVIIIDAIDIRLNLKKQYESDPNDSEAFRKFRAITQYCIIKNISIK